MAQDILTEFRHDLMRVAQPSLHLKRHATRGIIVGATASLVLGAALTVAGSASAAGVLVVAQTLGVAWLLQGNWTAERGWATATFVSGAAWIPTFLAPSWLYVADPSLLDVGTSTAETLAHVNLGLFALILGLESAKRWRMPKQAAKPYVEVRREPISGLRLAAWFGAGVAALAVLFATSGGPLEYVQNLDETGSATAGLTYVIWLVLAVKFAALTAVVSEWTRGERTSRWSATLLVAAAALLTLLGARVFVAIMLAQLLLLFALIRRKVGLGVVAPTAIAVGVLIIFGLGTVKRYQGYQADGNPDISFGKYLTDVAPREATAAYANNYADGVRLISSARLIVPEQADYEYGKAFVRLAVQPIPSSLRPEVPSAPALSRAFEPGDGRSYAMPLAATSYIQFGLGGIVVLLAAAGALIALVDRALEARRELTLSGVLALVAVVTAVPFVLRTGFPRGVAVALLDIVGLWIVAKSSARSEERRVGLPEVRS